MASLVSQLEEQRFTLKQWGDEPVFERQEGRGKWVPWDAIVEVCRAWQAEQGSVRTTADWGAFLRERHLLILEWIAEGQSFEQVARTLSMDPMQVQLISMTPELSTRAHIPAPAATEE